MASIRRKRSKQPKPSPDTVRALLTYDPDTGKLYWKRRPRSMFSCSRLHKRWNTRYADREAFTSIDVAGYPQGNIFDWKYRAHSIAWVIHYGRWPDDQIDHINGDRKDNRIENLRDVTRQVNQRNRISRVKGGSAYTGVWEDKKTGLWTAKVRINGETVDLGFHETPDHAFLARISYLYHNDLIGVDGGFTLRHHLQVENVQGAA